ncbi:hypothetical protein Tco_1314198 [Tanacetum coccineum]
MDSEKEKGSEKKGSRKKSLARKRAGEKQSEESTKRQKIEDDIEKEELKAYLDLVPREEFAMEIESMGTKYPTVDWKTRVITKNFMYYQIIRADGGSKNYKIFSEMLDDFDKQDILFQPDEKDEVWRHQHEYNLISWRLFDSCGIHILLIDNGIAIHMMIEKKYPLTQEMLSKLLSRKLEVDHESTMAYELLKFIRYGYIKNHKKTVKNGQARTRESEEYKKKPKIQSRSQKSQTHTESSAAAARLPKGQYNFVDTVKAGQGLIRSPGHDAQTIARVADKVEDVGYVRALQAFDHRMMTFITEVNLRVSYQAQSAEDFAVRQMMRTQVLEARAQIDTVEDVGSSFIIIISICIDIVIISYVHCILVISRIMPVTRQGANDAMTLESIQAMIDRAILRNSTHTQDDASQSSGGGLRRPVQHARICSNTYFMKCQPLNFKGTKGVVGLSQWLEKMESVFHINGCAIDNQVKGNDVAAYTQRFQELALMCTKFLANETEKVDKYISGLPDNIHGNFMSARPKTLNDAIELANDLMDQKLRTYAERHNNNKRKADDSS